MSLVDLVLPIRATCTMNSRIHWAARARKRKAERAAVALAWPPARRRQKPQGKLVVMLTRIGPKKLDDDNVQGALKAIRDEVAKQLGVDDGDPRIGWVYGQERGEYGVHIIVEVVQ